ncbi:tRNA methyltransferase TRMD/TRM10-type domain,tRNA methyltransferase TRM10-type domain [Cinara cedri]|uniref:tRNA (guanine(9)-N(1))-methyltransferase n=1 Tax=Cinara cedri TaxID=506608 RepID=A0A5E4MRF3_9HEMI|nr:tRNA methyltransferase TRMD/TRM10-type domain,tRNA methyltransferase TRM10-type domain [Cinara cedri]
MFDDKMKTVSESVDASSNNTDDVSLDQLVLNKPEKRPLNEESEGNLDNNIEERKKSKINDDDDIENNGQLTTSKRQIKKLQKHQKWLEQKEKRKEFNKEKKQEKKKWKAQMREAGIEIQKIKTTKMAESTCKQRIVLDMSYDDMMSDKDLCKCSSQILRCYSVNRRMENPMQLYICSYEGKIKETMAKHNGSEFWDIKYMEDSYDKVFKKEEIVYLTSESSNVLENIDENKVYIIGGLVDHNAFKGASLEAAENLGLAHARLPIDENIMMKTRKILTIIHVYEIISKVVSGVSWKESFMDTLPKRKMFSTWDNVDNLDHENCSLSDKQDEENKNST